MSLKGGRKVQARDKLGKDTKLKIYPMRRILTLWSRSRLNSAKIYILRHIFDSFRGKLEIF